MTKLLSSTSILRSTGKWIAIYFAGYVLTEILDYLRANLSLNDTGKTLLEVLTLRLPLPLPIALSLLCYLCFILIDQSHPKKLTKEQVQSIFNDHDVYMDGTVEDKK